MFTWICPKCGSEVPPSYDECPNCKALEKAKIPPASPTAGPQFVASKPEVPPLPDPEPRTQAALAPPSTPPPQKHVAVMDLPPAPPEPKRGFPAALITLMVAIGMIALLAFLYLYVLPNKNTEATNSPAPQGQTSGAQTPAKSVHPLAKHLEITGLRLTEDERQRTQIQFVIVNHSAADLPPLNMQISLKDASGKLIYEFPYAVPSLGPYESKDFTTPLKTQLKAYELPDWQFLRASLQINSAQ